MSGPVRVRQVTSVSRETGDATVRTELLPCAASFAERVDGLKSSLPDLGDVETRCAALTCDGCGTYVELDFDRPVYPAGCAGRGFLPGVHRGHAVNEDVQYFEEDGTWVKPAGAVRVDVTLKGGTAGDALVARQRIPGGRGNAIGGGSVTGLDMGIVTAAAQGSIAAFRRLPGEDGETVQGTLDAGDLPDRMAVTVGAGGYAHIITHLEG